MNPRTILAFILGAVVGLSTAHWLPRAEKRETGGQHDTNITRGTAAQAQATPPSSPELIFRSGPLSDAAWWGMISKDGADRAAALRQKTAEILAMPHLSQRRRLLSALLESYKPGDWRNILDGLVDREKIGGRFDQEYEILMERAAEVDGEVILARVAKESGDQSLPKFDWQKRCMANWAAANRADAIEWWNKLPDGEFRDFLSAPLVEGMARENIDEAWNAAQIFDPAERGKFAGNLVKAFASDKGPEAAASWIGGLGEGDGHFQAEALTELSHFMHQIDFPTQGKLVAQFADRAWAMSSSAFSEVSRVWGQVDAPAAMAWAASLPEGPARQMALGQAIHQWALKDADASDAWLASNPDEPDAAMLQKRRIETLRARGLIQD